MALKEQLDVFEQEIKVIEEKVPVDLQVSKEANKEPEKPVYFPNFPGGSLVINLWGSRERLADHLNIEKEEILDLLAESVDDPSEPVKKDKGAFEDIIKKDFDLRDLPIPKYYPKDGGRYITSGVVVAEQDGKRNLSYHRMMLIGEKRFTMRLCPRDLKKMYEKSLERDEDLDIAVIIGTDPTVLLSGSTSVGFETDELKVANSLSKMTKGEKIEITELDNGISVPADADYILKGRITAEKGTEGPFVDITGTYDRVRQQPVVEIDEVLRRQDAVFHALLPGGYEHFLLMGLPREAVMKRELKKLESVEVKDVRLTQGGCSWLHGVVSVKFEGNVEKIIEKAFEAHGSMKKVTVVDEDINVYDDEDVEWAIATRFQPDEDIYVYKDRKGSSLDPSAPEMTAKWGLDATKPWEGDEFERAEVN